MEKVEELVGNERPSSVVNSLLEAATRLMPSLGYGKTTTNRVAERAGVSIGSFYQYFKSKDDLFTKLMDGISARYLARLEELGARCEALPPVEATELFISEIVDFNFEHRVLLRELFRLAPRFGRLELIYELRNRMARGLTEAAQRRGTAHPDEAVRQFILCNAVCGVIDNVIFSTDCPLTREQVKRELVALVLRYQAG